MYHTKNTKFSRHFIMVSKESKGLKALDCYLHRYLAPDKGIGRVSGVDMTRAVIICKEERGSKQEASVGRAGGVYGP